MKTFILEWRPSISNYKMEHFNEDFRYLEYGEFNWSVWDWAKARSGDNFYLVKCGEGATGIVMKGFFLSDPYPADDWSGRGRDVHYMDMRPTFMVHPSCSAGLLTTEMLDAAIPGFQWNGGHSGRLLDADSSRKLAFLWEEYASRISEEDFRNEAASRNLIPEAGIDEALDIAVEAHYGKTDPDGTPSVLKRISDGMAGKSDFERICGFLGGILEESDILAGDLREKGFSEAIVDYLVAGIKTNHK